jgi:hypothetical protein
MMNIPTVSLSPEDWVMLHMSKTLGREVCSSDVRKMSQAYNATSVKYKMSDVRTHKRYSVVVNFNHCLCPHVVVTEITNGK